jgi:hypothetical protein
VSDDPPASRRARDAQARRSRSPRARAGASADARGRSSPTAPQAPGRPLWESPPEVPADPAQALAAAHGFVSRCRSWALAEIERRKTNGKPLHEWESYLRFTDHTLRELEEGTLDPWFLPALPPEDPSG